MSPHRITWRFQDSAGPRTHTATLTSYGAAHDLARLLRASPQVTCVVVQEPADDIPMAPVRAEQVRRTMTMAGNKIGKTYARTSAEYHARLKADLER